MDQDSTTAADGTGLFAGEAWFDPIEAGIRDRIRGFIEELLEQELTAALGRDALRAGGGRGRKATGTGTRERQLIGSSGPCRVGVPRARLADEDGSTREWRSAALPRYARMTRQVEALIAGAYLAGTNTRRVKRALGALFRGAVGKDVVSRAWRKVKVDWEAWSRRDLAGEDIVRLDPGRHRGAGAAGPQGDDRSRCWSCSACAATGRRCCSAVKNMGGESEAAWRGVLDDLVARGLRAPEFLIIDGAAGLERALAALWPDGAGPTLHGPQAPESPGPRAGRAARGGLGRLHGHDLRREREGGGGSAARRSCANGG